MPSTATRSLTDRRQSSGSATTPRATEHPPLPPISPPAPDSEIDDIGEPVPSPPPEEEEETPRKQKKSPLLTAHRLSTSSLDEVNLAGPKEEDSAESRDQANGSPPTIPPKDSPKQNFSLQNLSSSLPSVPWGQAPANKNLPQHSQAPPPSRKLTSPFAWLSRSSTTSKDLKSPPLSTNGGDRRNTAASVSTVGSNGELLSGRLPDGQDMDSASLDSRRTTRSSLKDQFKMLRMREEAGLTTDDQESVMSANGVPASSSVGSPDSITEEKDGEAEASPATTPATTSPSSAPTTVNPDLAPGTVSGISASASDASAPVDWEMWQQIVNLGPQALNGSNSEELNAAIKRGIPQTLRGVIWQVLADSRNLDLEETYKELVARGTDKERERHLSTAGSVTLNGQTNGSSPKENVSSRSSLHSGASTPATNTGLPSPSHEKDAEAVANAQAALEAVRKKKAKEDAIALQKLEKSIKRDLGSRTSYSKYFLSQKNQDGLFGLCKAYALFDEGVGYPQGLNFIVMPLLFNVSVPCRKRRRVQLSLTVALDG